MHESYLDIQKHSAFARIYPFLSNERQTAKSKFYDSSHICTNLRLVEGVSKQVKRLENYQFGKSDCILHS